MNEQTKLIVWDWNGTLLDDVDSMLAAVNVVLAKADRPPLDLQDFRQWQTRSLRTFYRNAGLSEEQIVAVMLIERDIFNDSYEPLADKACLRSGATEILEHSHAHNIHALILSNHLVDPILKQLERLSIRHHFKEILAYACRKTQGKHITKGEKLAQLIKEKKLNASNILIVGDTIEEIEIARDLKIISIALTGGCISETRLRAEKPDHLIHSLHEMKPILQERGFAL